jgi:hypothetical protein
MRADLATLSALKARVEAATGPDRELDAEVAKAFGWQLRLPHRAWVEPRTWTRLEAIEGLPPFTRSIDYAVALIAFSGVEPRGYELIGFEDPARGFQADVGNALATAPTAPLAILSALLTAKIAQLEEAPHVR